MNRNLIFAMLGAVAVLGLVGVGILQVFRPEATATLTNFIFQLLAYLVSAAGIVYGLGKVNEAVQQVKAQTNGTLTAKEERIAQLERIALDNGIDPQTGQVVTGSTATTTPTEPTVQPDPQQPG